MKLVLFLNLVTALEVIGIEFPSLSIGVTQYPDEAQTIHQILDLADKLCMKRRAGRKQNWAWSLRE